MARNRRTGRFRGRDNQLRVARIAGEPSPFDPLQISAQEERKSFEYDRGAVLRQIDRVRSAIDSTVSDLKMVAPERVFEESLSKELSRTTKKLEALATQLTTLRNLVTRAVGYPKYEKKPRKPGG